MSVRWLFIVQNFELKNYADSCARIEIVEPILSSDFVSEYDLLCSDRTYESYFKPIALKSIERIKLQVGNKPCVIYGAGLHTKNNFSLFEDFNVVAIVDQDPKLWGEKVCSLPVISPKDIEKYSKNILISSKAFERKIYDSLTVLYPDSYVFKLYEDQESEAVYFEDLYKDIEKKIKQVEPDVLFYSPTQPNDCLPLSYWLELKLKYPYIKYVTLWWDYDEDEQGSPYLQFERDCLQWADLCIENSNGSRLIKMNDAVAPYQLHQNTDKVKFLPSVFDPSLFYEDKSTPKEYDIAIFGTAAGNRGYWIEKLNEKYGDKFHHIGGFVHGSDILSIENYAHAMRKTRICVNTQTYSFREQCKGKVRETIACRAILLEEDNSETRLFINDSQACLFFNDFENLCSQIDRLLAEPSYFDCCYQNAERFRLNNLNTNSWTLSILNSLGILSSVMDE